MAGKEQHFFTFSHQVPQDSPPPLHVHLFGHRVRFQRRGDVAPIGGRGGGLHLLAPSEDGHVYVIEASTGCVNKIDLGERARTMVLADDVDGDGTLDLIVGTMSGEVGAKRVLSSCRLIRVVVAGAAGTALVVPSVLYMLPPLFLRIGLTFGVFASGGVTQGCPKFPADMYLYALCGTVNVDLRHERRRLYQHPSTATASALTKNPVHSDSWCRSSAVPWCLSHRPS